MNTVSIYGLRVNGKIVYVGQTYNLKSRIHLHGYKRSPVFRAGIFHLIEPVVFRKTTVENALRIEGQVIRAFKRRGQCNLNIYMPKARVKRLNSRNATPIIHLASGSVFPSKTAASRELNTAISNVYKGLNRVNPSFALLKNNLK